MTQDQQQDLARYPYKHVLVASVDLAAQQALV